MAKRIGTGAVCLALFLAVMPAAHAFFPLGFYDDNGYLRILTWDRDDFDTNNNGEIETNEGLDMILVGGVDGFSDAQVQMILESFDVWERVPTSFASFRLDGITEDPLQTSPDPDFLSVIAFDTDGAQTGGGILGLTTTTSLTTDGFLQLSDGSSVWFGSGEVIDSDIELDPATLNVPNPQFSLKAVMVHELGHLLGLGHSALNNLRLDDSDPANPSIIESQVFWHTNGAGESGLVGLTPTMYPVLFSTELGNGDRKDGADDLAPDDISGISWLYPRGSQSGFFDLNQRVRTFARSGSNSPTFAILGAHVVAWADTDNNPSTPVLPVFSALSGFYEDLDTADEGGNFQMKYLWKQMEIPGAGGGLFNPGYVFTSNPLNGLSYERQAPGGIAPGDIDNIHGAAGQNTTFLSEVFHEVENVLDISNVNAGTPLVWNFQQNTLVSVDTGRSLGSILSGGRPLFGEASNVCPLNVLAGTLAPGGSKLMSDIAGANKLRAFRDSILMNSAVGTAFVDLYYRAAPGMAIFLIDNSWARGVFGSVVRSGYWLMDHKLVSALLTFFLLLTAVAGASRLRFLRFRRAATLLLMGVVLFGAGQASALIAFYTTEELVEAADVVVAGTVLSSDGYWVDGGRIHTEVVVEIEDSLKGGLNKQSTVTFSVPGGTVGIAQMLASEMPKFKVGEEAILWLFQRGDGSYSVQAGQRGVVRVGLDSETGEKVVYGNSEEVQQALKTDGTDMEDGESGEGASASAVIALNQYLDYLRGIVRDLKRAGK